MTTTQVARHRAACDPGLPRDAPVSAVVVGDSQAEASFAPLLAHALAMCPARSRTRTVLSSSSEAIGW